MERRIDLSKIDFKGDPLKQIAGLIQKLSYRDMQALSTAIAERLKSTPADAAEALLVISENALKPSQTITNHTTGETYRR